MNLNARRKQKNLHSRNLNSLIQTSRIAAAMFAKILSFIIDGLDSKLIVEE
jgi:hypothetical protein